MYRKAKTEDKTDIAALIIQVWLHTYATEGIRGALSRYVFSEFTEEKIGLEIDSKNKQYFVCELRDHIVGVAVVDDLGVCPITKQKYPEIEKLYIQEHFSRQGIGSGLLGKALEYCRNKNLTKLWLTVNSTNNRAIAFYNRHGFVDVGTTNFELENEFHKNYVLHKVIV